MRLKMTLVLVLCSCTSVKIEEPELPKQILPKTHFRKSDSFQVSSSRVAPKNLPKGSYSILIKLEAPSEFNENGERFETSKSHKLVLQRLLNEKWAEILDQIKQFRIFQSSPLSEKWDSDIKILTMGEQLESLRKNNQKYLLFLSVQEDFSAPLSKFHNALKGLTLNLYDLLPIFKYNLGAFQVNYTIVWDAILLDVPTKELLLQSTGISTVKALSHGDDLVVPVEENFKRLALSEARHRVFIQFEKELESDLHL